VEPAKIGERDTARAALTALLAAQRRAFATRPPQYAGRLDALRALEDALIAREADVVAAVAADFGGRAAEETRLELLPLLNEIRYARRHLKTWMTPRRARVQWQSWPAKVRVIYRPLGVVGVVSPWNCPFFLTLAPVIGALAAGNHVLVKPSELAPASAALITSIVAELFPADYVSVVAGGEDTAAAFVSLPLDHLLFTGSTRVGKLVMRAASENLVPVTLELGGKSPAILHDTYPIKRAAERILTGKLYNAGQTCIAPDYVLVPHHRRGEFVAAACAAIGRMYPRLVDNRDYTRIVADYHHRRLAALVEDARRLGAEVIEVNPCGEVCDVGNCVFPPTIVLGVRDEMAIAREEIFGPILPVIEYRHLEDAIAYVNARPHPLAFYYFDDNRQRVDDVIGRVTAGGVTVNDCVFHVGQPALPFGGIGASGMGRYHGFDGFETFSRKTGIMLQRSWSPLALLRPPYTAASRRLLTLLLRG
jgi:coniferyl-aldehyde dehydrogenase